MEYWQIKSLKARFKSVKNKEIYEIIHQVFQLDVDLTIDLRMLLKKGSKFLIPFLTSNKQICHH